MMSDRECELWGRGEPKRDVRVLPDSDLSPQKLCLTRIWTQQTSCSSFTMRERQNLPPGLHHTCRSVLSTGHAAEQGIPGHSQDRHTVNKTYEPMEFVLQVSLQDVLLQMMSSMKWSGAVSLGYCWLSGSFIESVDLLYMRRKWKLNWLYFLLLIMKPE